ncbi:hypothetical protein [Nocardioides sp. B-3]|uniref:hypothetical protein n=1 Tax=Nocardioides sp. B-3 TaxID=2895565 RepID=UPI00215376AC|nr:hypothetical protein [Nocardioides sp. B-3]UUZ59145.1 hypothetical protein LP418_24980 [Nocardioides sp. B-3]
MRQLLVDFITSLEGCASAEGWPGFWGMEGPEYLGWLAEAPERDWTMLMGAKTYRLMSGFAATGEEGLDELNQGAQGRLLLDPDRAAGVGQHRAGVDRPDRGRAVDEGGRRARPAHDRQPHPVPVAARGRPRWTASAR